MNKNKIKQFAIWARTELIEQVSQRAYQYGITADSCGDADAVTIGGRALSNEEQRQRQELIKQIDQKGYPQVMEEVAYTWFNRFIALRFMEVNNYLPTHIRVFSDSNDQFKPEILNDVLHLELPNLDQTKIAQYLEANRTDDLYRYLLLLQCNSLNEALPVMFEPMGSYTEMLLPNNILKSGSILDRLVNDIPAEDWLDQVQIIGWLYQYYNTELNEQVYNGNMSKKRITKELLSAATTIYTPNWAVCYMVENSLGRLWLEGHPDETLKNSWQYYLEEAEQTAEVQAQLEEIRQTYSNIKPQEIKIIDPCMGSGHILVYAFDLLMQIYEASGVSQRDAVHSILANNLYGLDIDDRAAQLAYFAVMMKARQYDRRIFSRQIQPHLYSIKESNGLDENAIKDFAHHDPQLQTDLETLITELYDAKEYGSIVSVSSVDFAALYQRVEEVRYDDNLFLREIAFKEILPLIQVAEIVAQQYDVVVTNPPYLGNSRFSPKLDIYIKENYSNEKSDLCMVMFKKAIQSFSRQNGFVAFITTTSWMFLSSFAKFRTQLLESMTISSLIDFGTELFEGKVGHNPIVAWVTINNPLKQNFTAIRLVEYCYSKRNEKEKEFFNPANKYTAKQDNFSKIPGSPIAYWVSEKFIEAFEKGISIDTISDYTGSQNKTADNDRFLRRWWEVLNQNVGIQKKWVFYAKGGDYRKHYGNLDLIVNWSDKARKFYKENSSSNLLAERYWYQSGITYTMLTSKGANFRFLPAACIFDMAGPAICRLNDICFYVLAFLNSKVTEIYLALFNPTINLQAKDIKALPLIIEKDYESNISTLEEKNIIISKTDWDSFETSWDFKKNPLV